MSEGCNEQCGSCNEDCTDRKAEENFDFRAKENSQSSIKHVIAVVSGKGGVGKSLVTSLLAVAMSKKGYKTAILDADVTGPSIPKAFGLTSKAVGSEDGIYPNITKEGIKVMSINLLVEDATAPVLWRGPLIASTVKQFWTDVMWGDIDYLFIDMPPGTGDVPLTVFQSLPVEGIVMVTSPQELVSMIVTKAVRMAEMMNIPIVGLVENMSYFACPDNGKNYQIFGESHIEEIAQAHSIPVLAKLPIDPNISKACDAGTIEDYEGIWFEDVANILTKMEKKSMLKIAVASDQGNVSGHFGHCESFMLFDCENEKITHIDTVPNPGHKPGFLPVFLHEQGANVIISGGMGGGAVDIFNEKGIEVVVGATGAAKDVVEAYLAGKLKSTGSVCHEHQHKDECGE
ncbi:iron-sulfur cluster carrier protein MrpORP [uncultured Sphaerochaeta sp.]|uniref:iron-sulfur cluster carrier protein MrpORP n=1 Tax=uncultured Sphaerochaeta sp. TaxID=886478 RepID=UPI002A0A1282|nr:iron-sulfur cluster carrier protein MrpORP [uncultured Sphaerochaeta sp.]